MRNIVVGVKGTPDVEACLDFALDEAVRRRLPLVVAHTYSPPVYGELPAALFPARLKELRVAATATAEAALARARERVPAGRTASVTVAVLESDPSSALSSLAGSAALLVVGSRGDGRVVRGLRGSVAADCLHASTAPVAVVPHRSQPVSDRWLRSRVVVGVDGSDGAAAALVWAIEQAREWGSVLVPVVVTDRDEQAPSGLRPGAGSRQDLATLVWRAVSDAGGGDLEVHPHFLKGDVREQLAGFTEDSDLLVLGTRGLGRAASLLAGSTSAPIALVSHCPVVVVRNGQARREIHQRRARHSALRPTEWAN